MFNAIGVLVILAIAGVYVFVVKPYLKKEKKKRESYKTAEARMKASSEVDTFKQDFTPSGDPAELRVNDTLDIHGITYTVRGVVKYVEEKNLELAGVLYLDRPAQSALDFGRRRQQ